MAAAAFSGDWVGNAMQHPGNSHFLMALGRHSEGHVVETLDDMLRDVNAAVLRTGKKGTITLKLTVSPNGDKGVEVNFDADAKAPRLSYGKAFYFKTDEGDLTREAPHLNLTPTGPSGVVNGGRSNG